MQLWPNQVHGLAEIETAIAAGEKDICVCGPTGSGKSLMMFERIEHSGLSTALYTDRRMLFQQISRGLEAHGIAHGLRAAGHDPRLLDDIQLCMIQTEGARSLKGKREVHRCQQIIIDELHKNAGDTMQQLIAAHRQLAPDAVVLGFTATPIGVGHIANKLIVSGTLAQMRSYGALVPAYTFGPDEPDTKWIGKITVGEGECGLPNNKRMEYAHQVFGRVMDNYRKLNPRGLPTLLFAPGVKESKWFTDAFCNEGISAAHIDGECVYLDGQEHDNDDDLREQVRERCESGDIKIVCNRFVLREGIDWPFLHHCIFATVFGSLTSYIQAGGRMLRAYPGKERAVIQDHGGNFWRHGSLNSDREWNLQYTDRIMHGLREQRIREKHDPQPITCPQCNACRLGGPKCLSCGYQHVKGSRMVLQKDGSLREMRGDVFRERRVMSASEAVAREWAARIHGIRKSTKPTVQGMTFSQVEANFAREHDWKYPPRTLPLMPTNDVDWFRPVQDVPLSELT